MEQKQNDKQIKADMQFKIYEKIKGQKENENINISNEKCGCTVC